MIKNNTDMKIPTFNDLDFQDHAHVKDGVQARLNVGRDDAYEFSVVAMKGSKGFGLYGDQSEDTYEVAVFKDDQMLPLGVYDDVLGWQTPTQISLLMRDAVLNGDAWADLLISMREDADSE